MRCFLGLPFFLIVFLLTTPLFAKPVEEIYNEAAVFIQNGDYESAVSKYKEAIVSDPKSALAYNLLGLAYRFQLARTKDESFRKEEIAAYEKAVELDPSYWVSMINLGNAYYSMGDKKKAADYFKKALAIYPEHPERPDFEKKIAKAA